MPAPHEHRVRVRYGETDQMAVVHHANYLHYMEDGRTRLMQDLGCSYAELERRGFGLPVRRAQLRFWSGAVYDEELIVRTDVKGMRAASVTFLYEIRRDDGSRVATGEVELACVDLRSPERRPCALPEEMRAVLEARVAP
jgi:acyl-CoA thioester hydrolase